MRWRAVMVAFIGVMAGLIAFATQAETTRLVECARCPPMISIPAGSFQYGNVITLFSSFNPQAPQRVAGFYISETEITAEQFADFLNATGVTLAPYWFSDEVEQFDHSDDEGFKVATEIRAHAGKQLPVVLITYAEAEAYAEWLSDITGAQYAIPDDAQWEYVARGHSNLAHHFGLNPADICQFGNVNDYGARSWSSSVPAPVPCSDHYPWLAPVRSFPANPFGIFDLIGNAWEWTSTCADEEGDQCFARITRFGTGKDLAETVARGVTSVSESPVDLRSLRLGFRVVREK